jgi:anti-sigma factor RsiW
MNRTCSALRLDLYEYAAGRLGVDQRLEVEKHLSGCAECRAALEGAREVVSLVRDWAPEPPSADFRARVRQAIMTHEIPAAQAPAAPKLRFTSWKFYVPLAVAATIVVAVAVSRLGPPASPGAIQKNAPLSLEVTPAPTPIRVAAADPAAAVATLVDAVAQAQGTVNRRRPVDNGTEVTFLVPDAKLAEVLAALRKAGTVSEPASGFRDGAGRIVILFGR